MKANEDLRREMRMLNIPFWALAQVWGCNETTAIKRFRTELPDDVKKQIMVLIHQVSDGRK